MKEGAVKRGGENEKSKSKRRDKHKGESAMTTGKAKKLRIIEALKARQKASDPLPRVDSFDESDHYYNEVALCNECGEQGTATRPLFIHDAGDDEFIVPVGCHESCFHKMGSRSANQQGLSHNECAALDGVQREELVMASHKWDEARKYEQEEFTFDDDAFE
jgi:hypothetical protein